MLKAASEFEQSQRLLGDETALGDAVVKAARDLASTPSGVPVLASEALRTLRGEASDHLLAEAEAVVARRQEHGEQRVAHLHWAMRATAGAALVLFVFLGAAVCWPTGRRVRKEIELAQGAATSAEDARRKMEDFARASSDWFWEMDTDLRFSYLSERFRWGTDIDPAVFLGHPREEIALHSTEDANWTRHLEDLQSRRPFRDFRYAIASVDGAVRHFKSCGVPLFDRNGRFAGYRGTSTEITAQVETGRQRDQLLAFQAAVLDGAASAIIATDEAGRITLFNKAAERILGYGAEMVGIATPEIFQDPAEVASRAAELGMLPGLDGPATLAELRRLPGLATTPAIFVTAKALGDDVLTPGVIGFIPSLSTRWRCRSGSGLCWSR